MVRCWEAGASIVAVHARRPDDGATCDPEIYGEINRADQQPVRHRHQQQHRRRHQRGHGQGVRADGRKEIAFEERIKGTLAGAEMCTFDPHMQYMHKGDLELLLDTSWSRCIELGEAMKERGIKPEWEIMSLSDLNWVNELIAHGVRRAAVLHQHRPRHSQAHVRSHRHTPPGTFSASSRTCRRTRCSA